MTGPEPRPGGAAIPDAGVVADAITTATLSVPGVMALHTGAFGEVATHLPGRKVGGVRVADGVTEVHVTVAMGADILGVAQDIRTVVEPLVGTPVQVYVEDVTAG